MKSTIYLLCVGLFALTSCKTKKIVEKHPNGNIIKEYSVLKSDPSKMHGKCIKYYDSGKLLETARYKNGKVDGERILYFENGQKMIVEHYILEKMDGTYETFYEHGGMRQQGAYKDNKVFGVWKNYYEYPKNQIKESFSTKDGRVSGWCKEYSKGGKLIIEGNKIEILDGLDVFDGQVKMYDTLTGKPIYRFIFDQGKMIKKDSIH